VREPAWNHSNGVYRELHQKWLSQPTRRERQQKDRISDQVRLPSTDIHERQDWNKKEVHVYYTFKSSPLLHLKHELRHLWKKYYNYDGLPNNSITLKVGTRTNKSFNQLLVKKKPPKSMLRNNNGTLNKWKQPSTYVKANLLYSKQSYFCLGHANILRRTKDLNLFFSNKKPVSSTISYHSSLIVFFYYTIDHLYDLNPISHMKH
jgi:hypothetical protein